MHSFDSRGDLIHRRIAIALALSLLAHALLLSLQFGIPGPVRSAVRLLVKLAPPVPMPVPADNVHEEPRAAPPAGPVHSEPNVTGMRLTDPAPAAVPARPPRKPRVAPAKRGGEPVRKHRETLTERVIADESKADSRFSVPQPEPEQAVPLAESAAPSEGTDEGKGMVSARADAVPVPEIVPKPEAQAALRQQLEAQDAARVAEQKQREDEIRQEQVKQAAQELALRQQQEQRDAAQVLARERAAQDEARLAAQQRAAREQEDRQRIADEQARLARQREQEQRQTEAQARVTQQRIAEEQLQRQEQARLAAQREAELRQQQAAEQARLAAQRADALRQQQAAEQARLAAQHEAELRQQQAAEQARLAKQGEEALRQQQAAEQARLAARREEPSRSQRGAETLADGGPTGTRGAAPGSGAGNGGVGSLPQRLSASDLGSRARDMMRGLDVLGGNPPRASVQDPQQPRRIVSMGAERDVPLRLYIDSFRQKIERNGTMNGAQLSSERVRIDPVVSVAIRSDGSVEDVLIVRSSGHADVDAAVRRIVRVNARYAAFPPNVAAHYDVIEIRRIWTFADGLKLLEEVR
jgi:TonB family protein